MKRPSFDTQPLNAVIVSIDRNGQLVTSIWCDERDRLPLLAVQAAKLSAKSAATIAPAEGEDVLFVASR